MNKERVLLQEILNRLSTNPMQDDELAERIRGLGIEADWETEVQDADA